MCVRYGRPKKWNSLLLALAIFCFCGAWLTLADGDGEGFLAGALLGGVFVVAAKPGDDRCY